MRNIDDNTADILKAKLNELFSDGQKKEIFDKIKDIDKSKINEMLENSNLNNLSRQQLISIINNVDKKELMEKLRRL